MPEDGRAPQYFARAAAGGWLVVDHRRREPIWRPGCTYEGEQQGRRLHNDPISDRETAQIIAQGLNDGTIQPDELADA